MVGVSPILVARTCQHEWMMTSFELEQRHRFCDAVCERCTLSASGRKVLAFEMNGLRFEGGAGETPKKPCRSSRKTWSPR